MSISKGILLYRWAEGKRQREWPGERTGNAKQEQEAEGQTVGRTWTRSRRRTGHGRPAAGVGTKISLYSVSTEDPGVGRPTLALNCSILCHRKEKIPVDFKRSGQ